MLLSVCLPACLSVCLSVSYFVCLSVSYLEDLRDVHEREMISAVRTVEDRMRADAEQLLGLERAKLAG